MQQERAHLFLCEKRFRDQHAINSGIHKSWHVAQQDELKQVGPRLM